MNQSNSYVTPKYPQLQDNPTNEQMTPNKNNLNVEETKHILFFSNFCSHCKKLLESLQKQNILSKLDMINIDNRYTKDTIVYITLNNNQTMPLPPMINSVPTLCILPNHEILKGKQILEYYTPISKNIEEERSKINLEPNPFSMEKETIGVYGVSSDNFSYWDTTTDELSAEGNGGTRQMYNYTPIDKNNTEDSSIYTPENDLKENKMKMSLEQLEQQRNTEI